MKRVTELEGKSCDDEVFTLISKSADGAMRDALSVLDQLLTKNKEHINIDDAMEVLGISSSELLFSLSKALVEKNVSQTLFAIDEIYKEGVDFNTLSSQILSHFRDLLLVKTMGEAQKIIYTSHLSEFQEIAGRVNLEDLLIIIDILKNLSVEIKYADNKRVVFEMNAIKICNRVLKDDLILRVKALEDKVSNLSNNNYLQNNFRDNETITSQNNFNNIKSKSKEITNQKENSYEEKPDEKGNESIEKSNQSAIIKNMVRLMKREILHFFLKK